MKQEALDLLLDQMEAGAFCTCLIDRNANEIKMYYTLRHKKAEISHYTNCIGRIKVAEIIYEADHGEIRSK